jgi:type I restriction enzyme S subunit
MLLRPNSQFFDGEFMVYNFYSANVRGRMLATASGLTVPHLNVSGVRDLLVPVPSLHEQKQIAESLNAVAQKLQTHNRKHAAVSALFRTLLHELMTARLRVHDLVLKDF